MPIFPAFERLRQEDLELQVHSISKKWNVYIKIDKILCTGDE
jgi:hypothetical protein